MMFRLFIIFSLATSFLYAKDRYEARNLKEVQAQVRLLNELHNAHMITDANFQVEHKRLQQITYTLTYGQLPKKLTQAENIEQTQRFDWLSTGLIIVSILIGLKVLLPLIRKILYQLQICYVLTKRFIRKQLPWIAKFVHLFTLSWKYIKIIFVTFFKQTITVIKVIPFFLWEVLFYTLMILSLIFFSNFYLQFVITTLLSLTTLKSIHFHAPKKRPNSYLKFYLFILSLLWTSMAYFAQSSIMGFIAIGLINTFLGFSISIYPDAILIEFAQNRQRYIFKSTLVSLALLLLGWLIFYARLLPHTIGMELFMFADGLYFFLPLSFYSGILIISGIWFDHKKYYHFYNIYAFSSGLALLLLAYLYSMGFLFWIGALFMIWLLSAKYYELIYKKVEPVYALTTVALLLAYLGYLIQNNLREIVIFMSPIL